MHNAIIADNLSKCYNRNIVFSGFSKNFESGIYGIIGKNGSGKSTLLKILCGFLNQSSGSVEYYCKGKKVLPEKVFKNISIASPYLQLIPELTLFETLSFHNKFKPFHSSVSINKAIEFSGLSEYSKEYLKNFSSGMNQRVKLLISIISDVPFLFLDEPDTNLDQDSIQWMLNLIKDFSFDKVILIASNNERNDMNFCKEKIDIELYKTSQS